ncbi:hypothetical protein P8452_21170 [Trifolium repens]|nr:hypothetical protein P8452_21170 [Trifolium repens]
MRWWQPARMVLVAGGDWRLLWSGGGGGWRLLAMEEFCYSGGSFFFSDATLSGGGGRWHGDCFNWVLEVVGFFSDDVIGGDELVMVRFNSLSTGVYHFST